MVVKEKEVTLAAFHKPLCVIQLDSVSQSWHYQHFGQVTLFLWLSYVLQDVEQHSWLFFQMLVPSLPRQL